METDALRVAAASRLAGDLTASEVRLQPHAPRYTGLTDDEVSTAAQAYGLLRSSVTRPSVRSTKRSTVFHAPAGARSELRMMDRPPKPGTEAFYRLLTPDELTTAWEAMQRLPSTFGWASEARRALARVRAGG